MQVQFKNLVRGESFARLQFAKWLKGPNPLSHDELVLIESRHRMPYNQ